MKMNLHLSRNVFITQEKRLVLNKCFMNQWLGKQRHKWLIFFPRIKLMTLHLPNKCWSCWANFLAMTDFLMDFKVRNFKKLIKFQIKNNTYKDLVIKITRNHFYTYCRPRNSTIYWGFKKNYIQLFLLLLFIIGGGFYVFTSIKNYWVKNC